MDGFKTSVKQDFLKGLNPSQAEAVSYGEGPLLVLAGPGSGKTRVIAHRIAYLIRDMEVSSQRILAVTFTKKAALEMKRRVEDLVEREAEGLWIDTFHATCLKILRKEVEFLSGYTKKFKVYTDTSVKKKLISKCILELDYRAKIVLPEGDSTTFDLSRILTPEEISKVIQLKDVLTKFEKAEINGEVFFENNSFTRKQSFPLPNGYEESAFKYDDDSSKLFYILYDLYKEEIEKQNAPRDRIWQNLRRDANELLTQVLGALYDLYKKELIKADAMTFNDLLLVTNGLLSENRELLSYYQGKFSHVLVDEYQDTDMHQDAFVKLLCEQHRNLFVVGDEDQSIYGWRGADTKNILNFEEDFKGSIVKLEQNYRSTKTLVAAAGEIIKENSSRKAKNLWTENQNGEKISVFRAFDTSEEGQFISNRIRELVESGNFAFNEMAVFYRNHWQSESIEQALMRQKIPYMIVKGKSFYQRKEITNILAYLRLIDNPLDWESLKKIINVPPREIEGKVVDRLIVISQERELGFSDVIESCQKEGHLPENIFVKLAKFSNLINDLRRTAQKHSAKRVIEKLVELTDYLNCLDEDEEESVRELINAAATDGEPLVSDFLDNVTLMLADNENPAVDGDRVSLMTIHAAKGLEFPVVFLMGLNKGLLPHEKSSTSEGIEEERRLFYVAVTRAKKILFLTCHITRPGKFSDEVRSKPSLFLDDVPSKYLDRVSRQRGQHRSQSSLVSSEKTIPASQNPDIQSFHCGQKVNHVSFGQGVVKKVEQTEQMTVVTVDFADFGFKKIHADFISEVPFVEKQYNTNKEMTQRSTQPKTRLRKASTDTDNEMIQLILAGEGDSVEFKSTLRYDLSTKKINKKLEYTIAKTIAAFLNSEGGNLFIGVDDNKNALGLSNDIETLAKKSIDGFELHLVEVIKKYIGGGFISHIKIKFPIYTDKKICCVRVQKSSEPIFTKFEGKEDFFVRMGASSQPLSREGQSRYQREHWGDNE